MEILNGIDRILKEDFGLKGKRLGLITNHSGVTKNLISSIEVLKENFNLKALFGPEHGVRGDIQAGGKVDTYTDAKTGLPVYSIYGESPQKDYADNRPTPDMLAGIDMLVMDIQDVGCRFYTFETTMYNSMEECAKAGKTFVLLDRINPINGADIEGNILEPGFRSFVGAGPVLNRHGMTMGELARFYNKECGINCDLLVITLSGWKREMFSDEAGFHWVTPSPNLPNLDGSILYPGTCLFEGTAISEGRGTTRPFEQIGAPWLDAEALAETMNRQNHPGLIFRPSNFLPVFSKHQGEICRGVQLHITDRNKIKPVNAAVHLLAAIRAQNEEKFGWRQRSNGKYSIDLLAGTDILRKSTEEYLELCGKDVKEFAQRQKPYLLY